MHTFRLGNQIKNDTCDHNLQNNIRNDSFIVRFLLKTVKWYPSPQNTKKCTPLGNYYIENVLIC